MKSYYVDIIFVACLVTPIIIGIIKGFKAGNLINEIKSIEESISLIISLIVSINFFNRSSVFNSQFFRSISASLGDFVQNYPKFSYYLFLIICTFVLYSVFLIPFAIINSLFIKPVLYKIEDIWNKGGSFRKAVISGFFKIPNGIILACFIGIMLQGVIYFNPLDSFAKAASKAESYQYFYTHVFNPLSTSNFAKSLPDLIGDSLKVNVIKEDNSSKNTGSNSGGGLVLYNGITLSEAVKSNSQIDYTARAITTGKSSEEEKAKAIYVWVGSNIKYDYEKAEAIMSDNFGMKSGAVAAYETRKGICFDYASLYVAMARANNIKVRIVMGQGFDGKKWVSHAWNEVFLKAENRWIKVDPTFYVGGNYFNNSNFDDDHITEKVIGEW